MNLLQPSGTYLILSKPIQTYPQPIQIFLNLAIWTYPEPILNLSWIHLNLSEPVWTYLNFIYGILKKSHLWLYHIEMPTGRQIIKETFGKRWKYDLVGMEKKYKTLGFIVQRNDYCKSWSVTHQMMVRTRRNWLTYELLHKKNLKGYIACNTVLKSTTRIFIWERIQL